MQNHQLIQTASVNESTTRLLNAIQTGDGLEMSVILRDFKIPGGHVDFTKAMAIPSQDRIAGLITSQGIRVVHMTITAAITLAMEKINLRQGLNESQIVEIGSLIIEQAGEDNLAIEDVMLFLQQLVTGKAGKIYDRLDIPTFFELFETYRQERHKAKLDHDYEIHASKKLLGPKDRQSEDVDSEKNLFREAIKTYFPSAKPGDNAAKAV